jgi:hypothetical protein
MISRPTRWRHTAGCVDIASPTASGPGPSANTVAFQRGCLLNRAPRGPGTGDITRPLGWASSRSGVPAVPTILVSGMTSPRSDQRSEHCLGPSMTGPAR